ncbi:MAG: class I SAM-dependent methyltransferase [Bacteroidales bacterium]|nr:class I SAM-dependent methyltransferase [Bacteroidales bacterium]
MDSIEKIHEGKTASEYFTIQNQEIIKLIPKNPGKILDVGCATGALGEHILKTLKPEIYDGIEVVPDIAEKAKKRLSSVFVGQAEHILPEIPDGTYDCIIMADSLEHTVDPWTVLKQVYRVLSKEGKLLISIPNVRNLGVVTELLVKGDWKYRDFGIMDQGHLRFFTKKSLTNMLSQQGFSVYKLYSNPINRWKKFRGRFIARMLSVAIGKPGHYEEFITVQWILGAEKKPLDKEQY